MYAHILVALDGSAEAETVLPYVEALATAFGSTVTLVSALDSSPMALAETAAPPAHGDVPLVVDPFPIAQQDRQDTAAYLRAVAGNLVGRGIRATYQQAEGVATDVILETAQNLGVDLIAMTTHGRGGLGRFVFGSITDDVLRHTPCPLLLVRLDEAFATEPVEATRTAAASMEGEAVPAG
jgi:nucleotide-binding universal stress UspA family protein